jgi:MarR family transcriptional regulator, organic hydroperoxide resistance regulator
LTTDLLYHVRRKQWRTLLESLGLTYTQYLVIATLWKRGELSVGEPMKHLNLDYGTMTPLLKRMEKRELALRTRNPKDERTVIVTLAPKGQARVEVTFYR